MVNRLTEEQECVIDNVKQILGLPHDCFRNLCLGSYKNFRARVSSEDILEIMDVCYWQIFFVARSYNPNATTNVTIGKTVVTNPKIVTNEFLKRHLFMAMNVIGKLI